MFKYTVVLLLIVFFILPYNHLSAQEEEYSVDFIHKDKLYKTGSWWMTIGSGYGYFPKLDRNQQNLNVDLTGRYKDHYFTLGYHFSGDNSILYKSGQRLNDIYLAYGKRQENLKKNFYMYAGPSFSYGYVSDSENPGYAKGFVTAGVYGEVQYIKKIFYDIGVGVSLYGSANIEYQVVGLQLSLYFSTAFIDEI